MRTFVDTKNKGRVVLLDSPQELIDLTAKDYAGCSSIGDSWHGRTFKSVEGYKTAISRPWEEGLAMVDSFRETLMKQLPEPEDRRRRMKWNDTGGTLDIHRILSGDPMAYRAPYKSKMRSPTNVALLVNTGNTGGYSAKEIAWRGAAAVAAVDLLEAAGYSCEFWMWNHAFNTYAYPNSSWFMACRLKACGDPLDTDLLVNATSAWYFRLATINARQHFPNYRGSGSSHYRWGGFKEHLDVSNGITVIDMVSPTSERGAIEAATAVLDQATAGENTQD